MMGELLPHSWQQLAERISGKTIRVRYGNLRQGMGGMAYKDGDGTRAIEMSRTLNDDTKYSYFLHECAHHRIGDVGPRPTDDELVEYIVDLQDPKNASKYVTRKEEISANAFSEVAQEMINKFTWPHSMDLTLKFKVFLENSPRSCLAP